LPAAVAVSGVLMVLALISGRSLVRVHEHQQRELSRRRLESLARAGAGLAHQLRTPLATIKGSTQLLLETVDPASAGRLGAVLEQCLRMERLLGELLDYARPLAAESVRVELGGLLQELSEQFPTVETSVAPGLAVRADPEHLRQILENLLTNALAVSPARTPVLVQVQARGSMAELIVADRGPGPGEDPERLFEPYVSGLESGIGLGLPIARALAESNGGRLGLRARAGGGTEAVLTLPMESP
jgi:signal transduction histidine kinase